MPSEISDVRGFQHSVLEDLARESHVPLPAIGWAEIRIDRIELSGRTYALYCGLEPGTNGVEATVSRIASQRRSSSYPTVRTYRCCPWRITIHTKNVFDDIRTSHGAPNT